MNSSRLMILFLLTLEAVALGRAPQRRQQPVPLLPPLRAVTYQRSNEVETREGRSRAIELGIEAATVGRKSSAASDLLGMQFMFGPRVFSRIALDQRIYLKPSLGYFRRGESTAQVGVTQNMLEAGLNLQFAPKPERRTRWLLGLSQRFEMLWSNYSVLGTSDSSSMTPRYRVGPSVGFSRDISDRLTFNMDIEATWAFISPMKTFTGLAIGFGWRP